MSKRAKFIASSTALSLGFVVVQTLENPYRFLAIGSLSVLTIILFFWSLFEGLGNNATLLVLVLPFFFTLAVGLFWFLIPATIFARLPIIILYGVGIYALCLTSNIFTVAVIRIIALSRAARGVGFVLTLFTSFLLYDAVFSIKSSIWFNGISMALISFPLFLQGLWTSYLGQKVSSQILKYSFFFSLGVTQFTILLYFWPVSVVVGSLFLTVLGYILLGLGQAQIEGKLFPQTVGEYLVVGILVFIGMFFSTRWGG